MPDITMCCNTLCPKKYECYRYMVTPGYWQSFSLIKIDDEACRHFWAIKSDRNIRSKEAADSENAQIKENWNKNN